MIKHVNDGKCAKCLMIMQGVDQRLIDWFASFQKANPDAHVAWGLRGEKDQNDAFRRSNSNAKWGQSAHNYGLAIDLFRITITGAEWGAPWFKNIMGPDVKKHPELTWGGTFARFVDLPHVEIAGWEQLVKDGKAKLCSLA